MNLQFPPGLPVPGAISNASEHEKPDQTVSGVLETHGSPDTGGNPEAVYPQNAADVGYTDHHMQPYYHGHGYTPIYPPHEYDYPPYDAGPGYLPQVGGGEYHHRLRTKIKLSPHAPKSVQRAAQQRAEAQKIKDMEAVNHLEGLDATAIEDITAGWVPSPAGSPAPARTPSPIPGSEVLTINAPALEHLFTPTPQRAAPSVDQLFTPPTAPSPEPSIQEAALDAMGFEPIEIPSPPRGTPEGAATRLSVDDAPINNDGGGNVKKGRPNKASEGITTTLIENVNKLFEEASKDIGKPITTLVELWHNTSKYGIKSSSWNEYQYYFKKNMEQEKKRAGLPDGDAKACWQSFKRNPNHQKIMALSLELEKVQPGTTIAQRQKVFKKLIDAFDSLASKASRERIETFIFLAGNSINEDSNLTFLSESNALERFTVEKLRMTPSEFTALAKSQIYSCMSDLFIKDLAATQDNQPKTPHVPRVIEDDESEGEGEESSNASDSPSRSSADDSRKEVKRLFRELFQTEGIHFTSFPWKGLLSKLCQWRIQITGWPLEVKFPSETLKYDTVRKLNASSQGIKLLRSAQVRILLTALRDPAKPIKLVSGISERDFKRGKEPLIINAPPPYDSKRSNGRRQFYGGRIDHEGPPGLGPSPAKTKVKRHDKKGAEIVDITVSSSPPSTRTRSHFKPGRHPKSKATVDSDTDSHDDDAPLVRSTSGTRTKCPPASANEPELSDSDPDGVNATNPGDEDFDQPEDDDQSEVEIRQSPKKSPKKAISSKGKGKKGTSENEKGAMKEGGEHPKTKVEVVITTSPHKPVRNDTTALADIAPVPTTIPVSEAIPTNDRPTPRAVTAAHIASREERVRRAIESLGRVSQDIEHDERAAKRPRLSDPKEEAQPPVPTPGPAIHPPTALAQTRPPSRPPSNAPTAASRASSRAPSAPPRVPSAPPTGLWPPPGHPSTHLYPYAYPPMQRPRPPPPGTIHPGGHGNRPPYIRGGPNIRGRGGPEPYRGRAYGPEGYYGYDNGHPEGDAPNPGHYSPYAIPYGYRHQQAYPPYRTPGYGEPGPSHYPGGYGASDYPMECAENSVDPEPDSAQGAGESAEGWTNIPNDNPPTNAN